MTDRSHKKSLQQKIGLQQQQTLTPTLLQITTEFRLSLSLSLFAIYCCYLTSWLAAHALTHDFQCILHGRTLGIKENIRIRAHWGTLYRTAAEAATVYSSVQHTHSHEKNRSKDQVPILVCVFFLQCSLVVLLALLVHSVSTILEHHAASFSFCWVHCALVGMNKAKQTVHAIFPLFNASFHVFSLQSGLSMGYQQRSYT